MVSASNSWASTSDPTKYYSRWTKSTVLLKNFKTGAIVNIPAPFTAHRLYVHVICLAAILIILHLHSKLVLFSLILSVSSRRTVWFFSYSKPQTTFYFTHVHIRAPSVYPCAWASSQYPVGRGNDGTCCCGPASHCQPWKAKTRSDSPLITILIRVLLSQCLQPLERNNQCYW